MLFTHRFIVTYNSQLQAIKKMVIHWALALIAVLAFLCLGTAQAAGKAPSDAQARYKADRAACMKGETSQDRATCLREAGAALYEAKRGRLSESEADYEKDALMRCNLVSAENRDACMRGVRGEGKTTGSVAEGGILREVTTIETVQPQNPMPQNRPVRMPSDNIR